MNKGAKLVADAILGLDFVTVVVAGKAYSIQPPTIERLCGAIHYLSEVREANTIREVLLSLGDADKYAKALSWFIEGDESLYNELKKGKKEELTDAIDAVAGMLSIKDFLNAVSLAKSVSLLAAKPR